MNGLEIVRGLIDRGYSPHHAAALAGHMLQESGGNPSALNEKEGANGLMQWRLDRWDNLQNFAKAQGKSPNDPNVQLDFVGKEFAGPEAKAGRGFLAAPDLESASAALKPYIRYGDNSDAVRLGNAQTLFGQVGAAPVGALTSPAAPVDPVSPVNPTATSSDAPLPLAPSAPVGSLAGVASALGGGQQQPAKVEFLPEQQIQMARPMVGQSQQIAAALAKTYGFGA